MTHPTREGGWGVAVPRGLNRADIDGVGHVTIRSPAEAGMRRSANTPSFGSPAASPNGHQVPYDAARDSRRGPMTSGCVVIDGKQFALDGDPFTLRGICYGTFQPRSDGERYGPHETVRRDFAAIAGAGFNTVRTYTPPPDDVVDEAGVHGLRMLAGIHTDDWRYLLGMSRREQARQAASAAATVRETTRRLAGRPEIVAVSLGNEIPADVVRWFGTSRVASSIDRLTDAVKEEDPGRLVTYANYPSTEYLPLDRLDFLTVNVFLDDPARLRAYLTRLHHLAADRPLVLGELGSHAAQGQEGERAQALLLDRQLETALERGVAGTFVFAWTDEWWVGDAPVEGWQFGLTRADRSARPALATATHWNKRSVEDLPAEWPSVSIVICARNEERLLPQCLTATTRLQYPDLEIIVVDDGSTDATRKVSEEFDKVRTISIEHGGLGNARNVGLDAAAGDVIVYLDADAYPSTHWLRYLILGFDDRNVGAVGGPNLPPPSDPPRARRVALAPGGPVHVLVSDDRAEHVPGCNMAFWRSVLIDIGGFDPVYRSAGDDVDVCWKVLDRGWEIAFHPAAVVWHHSRSSLRGYLRQQRGYGRADALVAARHPDRFTRLGAARWQGRIYGASRTRLKGQPIYRGPFGTAPYQSAYRRPTHGMEVVHQVGVPLAMLALMLSLAVAFLWWPAGWMLAGGCAAGLMMLFGRDTAKVRGETSGGLTWRMAAEVAVLHLLQPLARWWGRSIRWRAAQRVAVTEPLPAVTGSARGGVLLFPTDRPRGELTRAILAVLRRSGYTVGGVTGWEDHDGSARGSTFLNGTLITSEHPSGTVQVRIRRQLRTAPVAVASAAVAFAATGLPTAEALALVALVVLDVVVGWWRLGPRLRRILRIASQPKLVVSPVASRAN